MGSQSERQFRQTVSVCDDAAPRMDGRSSFRGAPSGLHPPVRMADVWTAAAQGQIGRIIKLLTSDDPPVPEQLDGAGRTAAFYAQAARGSSWVP